MNAINELDAFCVARGIPVDRARLVSRNLVLKEHAKTCNMIITSAYEVIHGLLGHPGDFLACERPSCVEAHVLLVKLQEAIR